MGRGASQMFQRRGENLALKSSEQLPLRASLRQANGVKILFLEPMNSQRFPATLIIMKFVTSSGMRNIPMPMKCMLTLADLIATVCFPQQPGHQIHHSIRHAN